MKGGRKREVKGETILLYSKEEAVGPLFLWVVQTKNLEAPREMG